MKKQKGPFMQDHGEEASWMRAITLSPSFYPGSLDT